MTCFPSLDVWFNVAVEQIRHVAEILSDLDGRGGLIGGRLKYKVKSLVKLKNDYRAQCKTAKEINNRKNEKLVTHKTNEEKLTVKKPKELVV